MDFDLGPSGLLPTMEFAEALMKQLAPEDFFEERNQQLRRFGAKIHDDFYEGHVGKGQETPEFIKCLLEFACQNKRFSLTKGQYTFVTYLCTATFVMG